MKHFQRFLLLFALVLASAFAVASPFLDIVNPQNQVVCDIGGVEVQTLNTILSTPILSPAPVEGIVFASLCMEYIPTTDRSYINSKNILDDRLCVPLLTYTATTTDYSYLYIASNVINNRTFRNILDERTYYKQSPFKVNDAILYTKFLKYNAPLLTYSTSTVDQNDIYKKAAIPLMNKDRYIGFYQNRNYSHRLSKKLS